MQGGRHDSMRRRSEGKKRRAERGVRPLGYEGGGDQPAAVERDGLAAVSLPQLSVVRSHVAM